LRFVQDKGGIHLDMDFRYHGNYIGVAVSSENLDLVESAHNMIGREFQLSNPAVPVGDRAREKWLNPTVFVAHHFDETGKAYYASLAKFLALLGFDVKEGSTYSTETVPTKVRKLIDRQDILVAVVSGNDTHDWLTAESSYALGKGKHVVPMVEEGTSYKATIHGEDLQQIRFPAGQIEKTFIPLLQEFTSVRVKGIF